MGLSNSKRALSCIVWFTDKVKNCSPSLDTNTTSSVKKIVNAILSVLIIYPTLVTAFSIGFTGLFLDAVDEFTSSKVTKFIVKSLIYIAAAVLLIPWIIFNLVTSLIASLIFLAIKKDISNQKSLEIENNQSQAVNKINNDQDYNQLERKVEQNQNELGNDSQDNQADMLNSNVSIEHPGSSQQK